MTDVAVYTSGAARWQRQRTGQDIIEPLSWSRHGSLLGGLMAPHEAVFFSPAPLSSDLETESERLGNHGPNDADALLGQLWVVPVDALEAGVAALVPALEAAMAPVVARYAATRRDLQAMLGVWQAPNTGHALVGAFSVHPDLAALFAPLAPAAFQPVTPAASAAALSEVWAQVRDAGAHAPVSAGVLSRLLWPQLSPLVKAGFLPDFQAFWTAESLQQQLDEAPVSTAPGSRPRL